MKRAQDLLDSGINKDFLNVSDEDDNAFGSDDTTGSDGERDNIKNIQEGST